MPALPTLLAAVAMSVMACTNIRYIGQAALGQAELLTRARPIEHVIADPSVDVRTRILLSEVAHIKAFGASYGLATQGKYTEYTDLPREAAVWFVGAADPLSFTAKQWCFPIAGCFAGVGWFDETDAIAHKQTLERRGLDAFYRPASAYSTGTWFPDPMLSTMLSDGEGAFAALANVILHESVHATVLVPHQPFFNESFAEYVGDVLTDAWLEARFGPRSTEQAFWALAQVGRLARTSRLLAATKQLESIYASSASPAEKLAQKAAVIDTLVADLRMTIRPNNASLIETRVYHGAGQHHAAAHRACGSLQALLRAARTLKSQDIGPRLTSDLAAVPQRLATICGAQASKPSRPHR